LALVERLARRFGGQMTINPALRRTRALSTRTTPVTAEEIKAAAVDLFAVRGYPGTTMRHIAAALGIQAPGLYNHVGSKQEILADIMTGVMTELLAEQRVALASTADVAEQVRRVIESHVRYHCRHQRATFIGNREIPNLDEPTRSMVVGQRDEFERKFRGLIERGMEQGRFVVGSARLASYAILEMGIGVAGWYREDGELSESQVAYEYGEMALRILRAPRNGSPPS
jgi:AcrR family transcriptional regulator